MEYFQDGSSSISGPADIDFKRLWQEAKSRWLRPTEVYEVLMNHSMFTISKEPLTLPPSGTLVLFNRKLLRNFRKDGHPWRKKKDNKTVKEAHEHLKVGSEEKIHVYYAHGDGDSNLQRRSYWLLDKALEHIVLVHYLEIKEVRTSIFVHQPATSLQNMQSESSTMYNAALNPYFTTVGETVSHSESAGGPASGHSYSFSDLDSNENSDFDKIYIEDLLSSAETGLTDRVSGPQWSNNNVCSTSEQVIMEDAGNTTGSHLPWDRTMQFASNTTNYICQNDDHAVGALHSTTSVQYLEACLPGTCDIQVFAPEPSSCTTSNSYDKQIGDSGFGTGEIDGVKTHDTQLNMQIPLFENSDEVLKKLDSLDRWMRRELPSDNQTCSIETSTDSTPPCVDLVSQDAVQATWEPSGTEEMTSFTPRFCFEITEYSPTWSFSSENSKVIIVGNFNGDMTEFKSIDWCCMFNDNCVHVDVIQLGVLRFLIPEGTAPGIFSFYISDGGRQLLSCVKQFEVKESIQIQKQLVNVELDREYEELRLQCRLAHLLLENSVHYEKKVLKHGISMPSACRNLLQVVEQEWCHLNGLLDSPYRELSKIKEQLLQFSFRCMVVGSMNKGPAMDKRVWESCDSSGQAVLHLASALGYEWVINVVQVLGMSIDFRDKHGWTALHWAAYYGRERMVAALLVAGAKPGATTDPTSDNISGCTPAEIADAAGHEGLAGYLSEQDLVSHLNSLTLEENEHDKLHAQDEGQRIVDYLRRSFSLRRTIRTADDELALEDSLSAVGKATVSAARIHAAFKEYFTRERLRAIEETDEYGFTIDEQMAVQRIQKAYRKHRERKKREHAALHILSQFRTWKTRRNFLGLRQNVIKIQAYFRMYRARKQYQKLIWSVGVLEKGILRWYKRKKGLRGYQPEVCGQVGNNDDFLQVGRKQAEEALERSVVLVQSMVRSKIAREQYRRMKENFLRVSV
ncbi:hypothetical protein KP509_31G019600 [Ceratopteris richardii]|uniref:CG-1 domain-containing protein n=1 Tax=Ceratopteris richardii TaxID=49495 RepID=A0A8T2QW48_CERRI|nr:hypothetical protein KP509_31G019600 [Ceratopteris richardii]